MDNCAMAISSLKRAIWASLSAISFLCSYISLEKPLTAADVFRALAVRVLSLSRLLRVLKLLCPSKAGGSTQQGASWCIQVQTSQTKARKSPKGKQNGSYGLDLPGIVRRKELIHIQAEQFSQLFSQRRGVRRTTRYWPSRLTSNLLFRQRGWSGTNFSRRR